LKALVIDDSRAMRTIIGQILKSLGYEVADAGNGR
jgi:two-component system chemotaxis response regulator CheY